LGSWGKKQLLWGMWSARNKRKIFGRPPLVWKLAMCISSFFFLVTPRGCCTFFWRFWEPVGDTNFFLFLDQPFFPPGNEIFLFFFGIWMGGGFPCPTTIKTSTPFFSPPPTWSCLGEKVGKALCYQKNKKLTWGTFFFFFFRFFQIPPCVWLGCWVLFNKESFFVFFFVRPCFF